MTSKALQRFQRHAHKGAFFDATSPGYVSFNVRSVGMDLQERLIGMLIVGAVILLLGGLAEGAGAAGVLLLGTIIMAVIWLVMSHWPEVQIIITGEKPKPWLAEYCLHPSEIERLELREHYVPADGLWSLSEHDWSLIMRLKTGEQVMLYKAPQIDLGRMRQIIAELVKRWQIPVEMPETSNDKFHHSGTEEAEHAEKGG